MSETPKYGQGGTLDDLIQAADDSVRAALSSGQGIREFLTSMDRLEDAEMSEIVDQAIRLLESFYVHLPLKKAMHAVDPLQRLRLLQRRIAQLPSELAFHHEMTDIFTSLRDLHTNYILPSHFAQMVAFLPFRVEACVEGGERKYIVSKVATGFSDPNFVPGVQVRYWNGVPVGRAVEIAAAYHAGSNPEARHARGVAGLTLRAMSVSPPPDEEWVTVGFTGPDGASHEIRLDWTVSTMPEAIRASGLELSLEEAAAFGLDLEGDTFQRMNKMLFAQDVVAAKRDIYAAQSAALAATGESRESAPAILASAAETAVSGTGSTIPDILAAKVVEVDGRKYAYLRIFSFAVNDKAFVDEVVRLLELPEMPRTGLIIDVRGNGGGLIWAGERLLQLFTPRTIEPSRFQFISSAANLSLCRANPAHSFWAPSLQRALETGAAFSAAFPLTPPDRCNDIGQRYYGPVLLVTDARCYSTTDIFAAGFRDHAIGTILGADGNTGAGGANVWTLELLNRMFTDVGLPSPLTTLAKGAGLRVAIRRTLRVGTEAGTELEDLGVRPDEIHAFTREDILRENVDLINRAAQLLSDRPTRAFEVSSSRDGNKLRLNLATRNVDYIDVFCDQRPKGSKDVRRDAAAFSFAAPSRAAIDLRGYAEGALVCARRLVAQ